MERFAVTAKTTSHGSVSSIKPQRNASFSSYLQPQDLKSLARVVDDTDLDIFQAERYFKESQDHNKTTTSPAVSKINLNDHVVDGDGIDVVSLTPRASSVSSVYGYGRTYTSGSFHATPTASSEASWNSQSGLLSNPLGSSGVHVRSLSLDRRKKKGPSTKWCFGIICPCSGKKSVGVVEEKKTSEISSVPFQMSHSEANCGEKVVDKGLNDKDKEELLEKSLGFDKGSKMKAVHGSWKNEEQDVVFGGELGQVSPKAIHFSTTEIGSRIGRSFRDSGGFSFPVLNPSIGIGIGISSGAKVKPLLNGKKSVDDPPRESLEVFQPPEEQQKSIKFPQPGDNNHQSFSFLASPKTRMTVDDDLASDASSDLFEIESLSTQTTSYPTSHHRNSLDEFSSYDARQLAKNEPGGLNSRLSLDELRTPSIAPTECYEPSEASINWSVTTAEGFDGGSVTNMSISASDYKDMRCIQSNTYKVHAHGAINASSKRKGNGLLNCRCEKAVNVKCTAEQCYVYVDPSCPIKLSPSPARPRLGNISSMQITKASKKPPRTRISRVLTTH